MHHSTPYDAPDWLPRWFRRAVKEQAMMLGMVDVPKAVTYGEQPSDMVGKERTASSWSIDPSRQLDRVLDAASGPQTVDQLAQSLGMAPRLLGYMMSERIRKRTVQSSAGGAFVRAPRRQKRTDRGLVSLLECVRRCEADWELDRRLGLL